MELFRVRAVKIDTASQAAAELALIGADAAGVNVMVPKAVHRVIRVENVPAKAAVILKQEMLSKGGEVAVSRGVGNFSAEKSDGTILADGACSKTAVYCSKDK